MRRHEVKSSEIKHGYPGYGVVVGGRRILMKKITNEEKASTYIRVGGVVWGKSRSTYLGTKQGSWIRFSVIQTMYLTKGGKAAGFGQQKSKPKQSKKDVRDSNMWPRL